MVVEEFHVDLAGQEDTLLSLPEKWFNKLRGQSGDISFVDALQTWLERNIKDHHVQMRRSRAKTSKKGTGYRMQRLITSLLRSDKSKPPLCIFCLDDGADVDEACGRLLWSPDKPIFFAAHELCTLMIPEVLTVDNPSSLGKQLFDTDIKQLNDAYARGRQLTCNICREKGALVGCCSTSCQLVFHLPCAIRSKCFIDYEEFRCYCERHSMSAFEEITKLHFSDLETSSKSEDYDLCCLCMDRINRQIKMHSVVRISCCGARFYHYECMKNATLIRGQEMRCPACNRPNEETSFEEVVKRQGIYFQTYNPADEPDEESALGNTHSRCYYSMARTSAKERKCLSSLGPEKYDDSDALNDQVFNPLEALNGCITCGVHCHRVCAGPPWSTYTPDGDGEEEKWQCDDCREVLLSVKDSCAAKDSYASCAPEVPSNPARRRRTRMSTASLMRGESTHNDENRVLKKRTRGDSAHVVTNGPPKKQAVISKWFTTANRHGKSSSNDLHVP
ncbi:hypothetical protein RB195_000528 [Necator americanus]|uniref:PHD-finger n=1 Tax=Necator americanus TaxID=51031 RepID=A0ABR1DAC3_NECAM